MPRITNSSEIKMVFQKFVLRLGGRFGFILFGRGILFLFLNFHEYNGKLFKGDFFFKENPFILVILTLRITLHLPYSEQS